MKNSLQSVHLNGRSPVCVRMCVFKLPVSENSFRQLTKGHIKSFISFLGLLTF